MNRIPDNSTSPFPGRTPGQAGMVSGEIPGRRLAQVPCEPTNPVEPGFETPAVYSASQPSDLVTHAADLVEAQELANVCEEFLRLTNQQHLSKAAAAATLGRPASMFSGQSSVLGRYLRGGLAALAPQRRRAGAKPKDLTSWIESISWFIPAARWFYINSNLDSGRGSIPEAIRRVISLPHLPIGWNHSMKAKLLAKLELSAVPECPVELREAILARQNAGQPMVPDRVSKQIACSEAIVRRHRSPREWSLDYLCAPGSQRRFLNLETSQREIMQPGDWFGGDDATPGIGVCVPCNQVMTPCSQRYGVLIGRFQWLAYNDCRSDKLLGWDYVIRPRGSYRAEDVVNGIGAVTRAHGIPRRGWQLEGGTFNAKLVRECIRLLGCQHWRTYSPHQKAIESIFNRVWTRLAVQFPHADMGRYRNENEANCAIYEACKRGDKDPRKYFPPIELVIAAFEEEVQAHNTKRIFSSQYGQWVPNEFFEQSVAANKLREFSPEMDWIFSPFSVERKVHGMWVGCRVPMFEDFSVPYEFNAEWLPLFDGKSVRLRFDPRQPRCVAKVELLEDCGQHRAGEILGDAKLIGETTSYIRLVMGWADDDQRAGYIARQRTAHFMRRETRAIDGSGRAAYAKSEERDGIGQVTKIENFSAAGGVLNAGTANTGTQAGTGEPEKQPSTERMGSGSVSNAAVVNAPLSQSPAPGRTVEDLSARERRAAEFEETNALNFL